MTMKRILGILIVFASIALTSCEDELDVNSKLNYPPTLVSIYPKSSVKVGNEFDIQVVLADGPATPLSDATITLKTAGDNETEIYSVSETLSGQMDTVVVESEAFSSSQLALGDYKLIIVAKDTKGNVITHEQPFKVANQLYAANQNEMYIAGAFNGWGSGVMELVADNTWEIKEIDLQGGPFKFKNRTDWSDTDWGDSNCDMTMENTSGGGPDTQCDYTGLVNVRFNDETLKYTVTPSVEYASNVASLYLLGSFNNFSGPEPKFNLVANNTWEVAEFRMKAGDVFKFAENTSFEGKNYGDANLDGKAEEYGPNITLGESYADAFYKITFNDATRLYSIVVVRYPYPSNLYLVGGSTIADWNPTNSVPFVKTGDGKFEIYSYLTAAGGGFKFLQVKDWAGDWGKGDEGKVVQEGESNVTVAADGFYRITVDFVAGTYAVNAMNWGIIGSARTGNDTGWNADDDMAFVGGKGSYKWTKTITLFAGEMKFRANDSWDVNLGDDGANGTLEYGGANMNVTAGTYIVELILDPVNGYTYTITPQ
jgi:hypothetical protein